MSTLTISPRILFYKDSSG